MIINKSILHIMNFSNELCVFSQTEMENLADEDIYSFIAKHIEKVCNDAAQQTGSIFRDSEFRANMEKYCIGENSLVGFSVYIAEKLYERIAISDKKESADLLVADFSNEYGEYIAILMLENRTAYTHHVDKSNGDIKNEIIRHYGIMPSATQKIDVFALINKRDYTVSFRDKKRFIEEQDVYVLQELLQCSAKISAKEAIKTISKVTKKAAEEAGVNPAIAISKVKNYIAENAEISTSISPVELGREVFADSDVMQSRFEEHVTVAELPQEITVDKKLAVRTGRSHKIKTDTGIEITFPADYFQNHDYLEFINNPDGTISIAIKNVGKIINR